MINKTTFLLLLLISCSGLISGQTMVNDFEAGSPATVFRYNAAGETTFSIVANPNTTGNTSANVARLARTSGNWYELFGFNLAAPYMVAAGETRYLHVLVNYPAEPDVSVRMNSEDVSMDGGPDVRALNTYTDIGQWQDLVFQIDGGAGGATVNSILMLPDLGFQNNPAGFVLNNTDAFAYIDEFNFSDSATPRLLSTSDFELEESISLYPNPAQSSFKITTKNNVEIENVSVYNLLGKQVQSFSKTNTEEYDISNLVSGMYLVRMIDDNGNTALKKLLKN